MKTVGQKKLLFASKVMGVFTEIQKSASIHKTQIFELVKFSKEDADLFMYSFEQSYLKIFHSFHAKNNKKIPTKFENLAQSFFQAIVPKNLELFDQLDDSNHTLEIFNSFLLLCTEGIYSSVMNIRIMCARLTFILVKLIPSRKMNSYLNDEVQKGIINSTLHLLRTKVSTYRQLGIKLASLIIHVSTEQRDDIEGEMFRILAVEDNEQIRKLVITNLTITPENLDEVLIRLRDKNAEIRSIVAKKLQGQRFKLEDMTVSNLYKLLYDGYGSKEVLVKKECLRYFAMFFTSATQAMEEQSKNKPQEFIRMFRPEILLYNPHLYHLFDELVSDLLEEVEKHLQSYIRRSCDALKRGNLGFEIIWLKNAINSPAKEISRIYEEYGPTGIDLSKVLLTLISKDNAFAIFQLLQLFGRQKMPDEIGRNKMFDALKELLSRLPYFSVNPDYSNFKDTDICHIPDSEEIVRKKLMLSYYDMPIINTSFDLIFQIGEAMKNLRPGHYEIEMKEVMSEWNSQDENTLFKERELLQKNIAQLRMEKDKSLLENMKNKLEDVSNRIQQEKQKTRKVLMCISRLRYNCDLEMFMSIIKEELEKQDKANGLLLLGLYCLENNDKVVKFWGVFWQYIEQKQITGLDKNHLLVSLKVVIDFIVKFNCLGGGFQPEKVEDFSADLFMNEMIRLMLHDDPDIRILAIESLCRLLYHERVDKNNETTYFLILILLWLETSTETISAKSVHTVSIFIKSYIEKGNPYCQKLSQIFCQFFQVLLKFIGEKKTINKSLIKYNLTMDEFLKRTVFTVMTIFKYHKESRNIFWTYNTQESQIGPQEFLLLFFLREEKILPSLVKPLMVCDFFEFCGLETLIMIKKVLEEISESRRLKGQIQQAIKKLQSDIELQISQKNSEVFNAQTLQTMEKENEQKMKLLNEESRYLHKNMEERTLFIRIDDNSEDASDQSDEEIESSSSSSSQSLTDSKQISISQKNESSIRSRKKEVVIEVSESENDQDQAEETVKNKRGRKKETMPPAPIRKMRNRKK